MIKNQKSSKPTIISHNHIISILTKCGPVSKSQLLEQLPAELRGSANGVIADLLKCNSLVETINPNDAQSCLLNIYKPDLDGQNAMALEMIKSWGIEHSFIYWSEQQDYRDVEIDPVTDTERNSLLDSIENYAKANWRKMNPDNIADDGSNRARIKRSIIEKFINKMKCNKDQVKQSRRKAGPGRPPIDHSLDKRVMAAWETGEWRRNKVGLAKEYRITIQELNRIIDRTRHNKKRRQ